jgi:hypothetical protein
VAHPGAREEDHVSAWQVARAVAGGRHCKERGRSVQGRAGDDLTVEDVWPVGIWT